MSTATSTEPAAPPVPPVPPAPRGRRTGRRLLVAVLSLALVLAVVLTVVLGGLLWSVRTESGSAWLLSRIQILKVTGARGNLLGDFDAQELILKLPGDGNSVVLTSVGWRGVSIARVVGNRLRFRVVIDDLHAARVNLKTRPDPKAAPPNAPTDLRLPFELQVNSLRVGELHADALGDKPLREVRARVHLGAQAGALHRIDALSLAWDRLRAEASGRIETSGSLALRASLKLTQDRLKNSPADALSWTASAELSGPLAQPTAQATLRTSVASAASKASPQREQSLDAQATLRPFAAWPLADLRASTQGLDLSAFAVALPATSLSGKAVISSSGTDQPATAVVELSNADAGTWNAGKLPLRELTFDARARPNDPGTLVLQAFTAELGTPQQPAGSVHGSGRWTPQRWQVDATLSALQPLRLDSRAAAMQLSGPFTLVGRDFNLAHGAALDLKATLSGAALGPSLRSSPARAVQLTLDASATSQRVELRQFVASAGGARASAAGVMQRTDDRAPWHVKGETALVDFDPLPWWSGPQDSPWRKGPHRLNAKGNVDLLLPAPVFDSALPLNDRLAALQGEATLNIARSVLAGVALSGDAALRSAAGSPLHAVLKLDAAGNSLDATGSLAIASGSGQVSAAAAAADRWTLSLAAPELGRLAPLWRLMQPPGRAAALAGAVSASAHVSGRWPDLRTDGQWEATGLRVGNASVQQAQTRWQAGSSADAPVDVQGSATQARFGDAVLDTAQWQIKGSGRAHSAELRIESKALPPAWTDALQANGPAPAPAPAAAVGSAASGAARIGGANRTDRTNRTFGSLQAQGGLVDLAGASAGGWRGSLQQLELRTGAAAAAAGSAGTGTGTVNRSAVPLLLARDVALEVLWAGGPPRATVQPGRAELLGAALRWSRMAWQAASPAAGPRGTAQAARLDAEIELDAFPIGPLLARLQPEFGWGGDLAIVGHLKLRSAPTFSADVVLERARGDLTVTDEIGVQALGLTDLRLGLDVRDGTWSFTQALAGKTLGVAAGAVVARTSAQALWPPADTPLSGVLEVQVANLGTWGTWIPTGWRVSGGLRTSASIGGRFGAPEYTGEVRGSGIGVRNFLQGVNVSDGDVQIALQGATARIERFTAKAGAGTLRLEGSAVLGAVPKAQLKLLTDRFQLLGRVDRRIVASGEAQMQLDAQTVSLDGKFRVDEGLIDFSRSDAPELSDDVVVTRPTPKPVDPAVPLETRRNRAVAINLRVDLGNRLRLRGRGLDTGLQGDLLITSPGGRMAVNGSVRAVDGTYAAYGQKLSIDRGTISFNGPVENPRLDIEASRPNTDIRVGVTIAGSAQNPRIRLFSEPEVSDIDKLSWLVLGRASDGLGRTDTALLQRAALALLAGEGEGLTDKFTKAIGLDEVSLRQTDGETRETVIALGKQLSRRWYVGYERGLNSTAGTWQLIYRIAQRFTLRAQSGLDDSLDLIWIFRWQ